MLAAWRGYHHSALEEAGLPQKMETAVRPDSENELARLVAGALGMKGGKGPRAMRFCLGCLFGSAGFIAECLV